VPAPKTHQAHQARPTHPQPARPASEAALLVGLNYPASSFSLNGCWNDAKELKELLTSEEYGFAPERVKVLLDDDAGACEGEKTRSKGTSRAGLVRALYDVAFMSWQEALDVAVVSFSGHGSQKTDEDGDEADGLDEGICPSDVQTSGMILDDELLSIFSRFNPRTQVYVVFDCCHSGSVLDLPFQQPEAEATPTAGAQSPPQQSGGARILMMSGCTDSQTSADAYEASQKRFGGALTMALVKALREPGGSAAGALELQTRVLELLREGGFEQRPVLSSTRPITDAVRLFRAA
jgi:hypothetical protein